MRKRHAPPEAKPEPKPVAQKRSVESRLGEAMREVAREDGVEIHGKFEALAERAQEHWVRRATALVRHAAKLKVDIREKDE